MRHILYKTTNLENDRYYIGVHSTKDENFSKIGSKDGYLGSGKILGLAIKHYGRENFKIEILEEFSSKKETLLAEAELITEEFLKNNPKCYNVVPGGGLPPNYEHTIWYTNGEHDIRIKDGEIIPEGYKKGRKKCAFSEEVLDNIRSAVKKKNLENNPMKNEEARRKVSASLLKGYKNGRKSKNKSYYGKCIWVTDGKQNKIILESEIIDEGWIKGRTIDSNIWITNGKQNKFVKSGLKIPFGWVKGRTYNSHINRGKNGT